MNAPAMNDRDPAAIAAPVTQRGAVLVVSLIILLVLTLLALAASRNALVMERLGGSSRQLDQAFQAAEAALRHGEGLLSQANLPAPTGANGWYHYSIAPSPDWNDPDAWDATGNGKLAWSLASCDGASACQTQIAIEELPPLPDPGGGLNPTEQPQEGTMYRISARGFGGRGDTFVILQTTFRR